MSKSLLIKTHQESWECEDCGVIYDDHLSVEDEDGTIYYHGVSDGHFGDGDNLSDPIVVLQNVLKSLGYTVKHLEG